MKKVIAFLLAASLAVASLTACGGGTSGSTASQGGSGASGSASAQPVNKDSIVIGVPLEPPILDPQSTTAHAARQVYCNIYSNLLAKTEAGEFVGDLAESYEANEAGTEYTFHLRKGVSFHNGDELKASDVKFTLERGMKSAYVAFFYEAFDKVEAVDDYTVKVTLKYNASMFLEIMTMPQTGIVSEKVVTAAGDQYGREPIGSGPYQFKEWVAGDHITLVANESYYGGAPAIKECQFRIITDKSTGTIALEKGEIDMYYDISPTDVKRVSENGSLKYEEIGSIAYEHLVINCENSKFSNKLVRQALAYAIDRESVVIAGKNGAGVLAESQIPETMFGFSKNVTAYEYSPEQAKAKLAEAGFPDGFSCVMKVDAGFREKEAQVIQANLAEIGITIDIEVLEWGTFLSDVEAGNYELALISSNLHINDPSLVLNSSFNSQKFGQGGNLYRYANADLDKMIQQSFTEQDTAKREKLFEDILVLLHEEAPNLPICWNINNVAYNNQLKGMKVLPLSHYKIATLSW